ncbi:hypothetical protein AB0I95_15065 [Micromonospora sp. NPDC049751]|uniref:hypothetical protein n=1 Tax=Micromonospora sp. NPDC049751 TaxID=3154837 RepID=UPI0033E0BEA6
MSEGGERLFEGDGLYCGLPARWAVDRIYDERLCQTYYRVTVVGEALVDQSTPMLWATETDPWITAEWLLDHGCSPQAVTEALR